MQAHPHPHKPDGRTAILLQGAGRSLIHALKYHSALHVLEDVATAMRRAPGYADWVRGAVLVPALKPATPAGSIVVKSGDCTNCGRCLDVCEEDVFAFVIAALLVGQEVRTPASAASGQESPASCNVR